MRLFATLAFALSALMVAPAVAKDKKTADPNKKVCRRLEVTGSILGGKPICHTRAEWAAIDEANAATTEQFGDAMRSQRGLGQR